MALLRVASCEHDDDGSASVNDSFSITISSTMDMSSLSSSSSSSSCSFSSLEDEGTSAEESRRLRQELYKYKSQPNSPQDLKYFPYSITAYNNCDYLTDDGVSRSERDDSDSDSDTTYDYNGPLTYGGIFRSDESYRGSNDERNIYPPPSLCHAGTQETEFMGYCNNYDDNYTEDGSECTLEENDKILRHINKTNASILAYNHAMSQQVKNQESEQSLTDDTLIEEQIGIVIEGKARVCREAVRIATQWKGRFVEQYEDIQSAR